MCGMGLKAQLAPLAQPGSMSHSQKPCGCCARCKVKLPCFLSLTPIPRGCACRPVCKFNIIGLGRNATNAATTSTGLKSAMVACSGSTTNVTVEGGAALGRFAGAWTGAHLCYVSLRC